MTTVMIIVLSFTQNKVADQTADPINKLNEHVKSDKL